MGALSLGGVQITVFELRRACFFSFTLQEGVDFFFTFFISSSSSCVFHFLFHFPFFRCCFTQGSSLAPPGPIPKIKKARRRSRAPSLREGGKTFFPSSLKQIFYKNTVLCILAHKGVLSTHIAFDAHGQRMAHGKGHFLTLQRSQATSCIIK